VRTQTKPYLRTEAKSKLAELRDSLPPEDRTLLVLRIDKGMEWKDLARVMLGEEADVSDAQLTKESQRLRKRFQLLKDRLVEQGRKEGLFPRE
jgi:RNA polymerase sigma-70 factor (ECF subfamily)